MEPALQATDYILAMSSCQLTNTANTTDTNINNTITNNNDNNNVGDDDRNTHLNFFDRQRFSTRSWCSSGVLNGSSDRTLALMLIFSCITRRTYDRRKPTRKNR